MVVAGEHPPGNPQVIKPGTRQLRFDTHMKNIIKKYQSIAGIGSVTIAAANRQTKEIPMVLEPTPSPSNNSLDADDLGWRSHLLRPILVLLVIVIGFLIGTTHGSLAPIYVAGQRVHATISESDLQSRLVGAESKYNLQLKYPDGQTRKFWPATAGITTDAKATATQTRQTLNHSWLQRLAWWRPINVPLVTHVNQAKLRAFADNTATQVVVPVKNADLSIDGETVKLTPEAAGRGDHVSSGQSGILEAVQTFQPTPLVLSSFVIKPTIRSTDIVKSQQKAQEIIKQPVSFTIEGDAVTASPDQIAGWLDLSPVAKDRTVDVTVDSGKVLEYINSLAKRYVSQPRSRLVVNTDSGQVVLDPGADGVDVVNKDKTASSVASDLQSNKPIDEALTVDYAKAQTVITPAYDKWFVADLTTKRMYAYEKTTLVRTFLISAGAPATPTVTGDYAIYAKLKSQDMTGDNADGSRYFQPAVPDVNYFYSDYAIHGNYWRPESWFGNINSSHGCIGVDVTDADWIYDWSAIGTHVIVHT